MRSRRGTTPLDVNRPIPVVNFQNLSGALFGSGVTNFFRSVDRMVLGREAVPINDRPIHATDFANQSEPAQRIPVLLEFGVGQPAKPEVLPPS